jgi:hypothetical protein
MSAARDFTQARFGALTTTKTTFVDVSTFPILVRTNNPNCLLVIITNSGSTRVTLSYLPDVVDNDGLILGGNGAAFLSRVRDDGDAVGYALYAVSNAIGGRVTVVEILQETT